MISLDLDPRLVRGAPGRRYQDSAVRGRVEQRGCGRDTGSRRCVPIAALGRMPDGLAIASAASLAKPSWTISSMSSSAPSRRCAPALTTLRGVCVSRPVDRNRCCPLSCGFAC